MNYKLFGFSACAAVLALCISVPFVFAEDNDRYHQHIEAPEKMPCDHGDDVFCTHLPLVKIETGGVEIPGLPIYDENKERIGYTTTADGEEMLACRITVTDHETENNHVDDVPEIDTAAKIRVRGNSSRSFDKSGYLLDLMTDTGENNPLPVMGMDAHHEWALHGPFLDKTLIRNYMWYNIAGEIMDYAPNVRFCEVMLNGEYRGVYVMVETITGGKNGARLSLSVDKKDNSFAGYLVRLDSGSKNELKNIENFTNYSLRSKSKINIVYPGSSNLTQELSDQICLDFSAFEKALYSFDYVNPEYGYKTMIDVDSFVDYFLINEFTCNYDAGWLSTYVYKNVDGKFYLCIWDFNSACDNYMESMSLPEHLEMQNCIWYLMLCKDEDFTERIISRYYQLRKTYFSEEYLNNYIDEVIAYLGDAVDRNYEKWGYTFAEEYDMLQPTERNPRDFASAVEAMKAFLAERGAWLDENIHTLRQYSAESKVKKFNEHTE